MSFAVAVDQCTKKSWTCSSASMFLVKDEKRGRPLSELAIERRLSILKLLKSANHPMSNEDIAKELFMSTYTVKDDLTALSNQGKVDSEISLVSGRNRRMWHLK